MKLFSALSGSHKQVRFKSGLFGLGSTPSVPSAPPPAPTVNTAAVAADERAGLISPEGQDYSSTLLTGSANIPSQSAKKASLLGGV